MMETEKSLTLSRHEIHTFRYEALHMVIRCFGCLDKIDDISYLGVCEPISELIHLPDEPRCTIVV